MFVTLRESEFDTRISRVRSDAIVDAARRCERIREAYAITIAL
jgi:hypothetical protein